jgi:hypothetical protein
MVSAAAVGQTAVPSIWHRLRKRRHGGILRTSPVNDRGPHAKGSIILSCTFGAIDVPSSPR